MDFQKHRFFFHKDILHSLKVCKTSLRKTLTSGLGLDDMFLAWPAVVQLLFFIYSGIQ